MITSCALNRKTQLPIFYFLIFFVYSFSDTVFRPVLIVGPLADWVTERLLQDFPQHFIRCSPDVMHCSSADVEKGIANEVLVDYRKKGGSYFECTSVAAIRDICDKVVKIFFNS